MNRVTRHSFRAQDKQHICYGVDAWNDNASFSSYFSLSFLPSFSLTPSRAFCLSALCLSLPPPLYIWSSHEETAVENVCVWRLCLICQLRLDLFHVIPQTETTTCGLTASPASTLFMLLLAVALMFHTYFAAKVFWPHACGSCRAPAAFQGRFLVLCVHECVHLCAQI